MSRGQQGRKYAKTELVVAVLFGPLLLAIAPQYMGGGIMFADTWLIVLPTAGGAGLVIGFAWMIRIYRASFNPEPDHRGWRYRARTFTRR